MAFKKYLIISKKFIAIFLIIYLLFSIWIFYSVRSTLKIAFLSDGTYKTGYCKKIDKEIYEKINVKKLYPNILKKEKNNIKENLELNNIGFAFHNFKEGTVNVKYTYQLIDKKRNKIKYGAKDTLLSAKVVLQNGVWRIVYTHEEP